MRRVILVVVSLFIAGCGRGLGQLDRPAYVRSNQSRLCGSTVALDAHGEVWSEGGCENGSIILHSRGKASAAARERLSALMAALPQDDNGCPAARDVYGSVVSFVIQRTDQDSAWWACFDDNGLMKNPWKDVDDAFGALIPK